jgi:group I intron endonuclease
MHKSGIYKIENTRNGNVYIGSSINLMERKATHFRLLKKGRHPTDYLQNAYNKEQDKNVFVFKVITYCRPEDSIWIEQLFLDGINPEYNGSKIAGRPEHTLVVTQKMRAAKLGKPSNRKGKKASPETCEKISISKRGISSPKKGKKYGSNKNKGTILSEDRKQKISIATAEMWKDEEYRKKQAIAHSAHTKSMWENKEYRSNQEKRAAEMWKDPKFRWMQSLNAWHRKNVYWQPYYGA